MDLKVLAWYFQFLFHGHSLLLLAWGDQVHKQILVITTQTNLHTDGYLVFTPFITQMDFLENGQLFLILLP